LHWHRRPALGDRYADETDRIDHADNIDDHVVGRDPEELLSLGIPTTQSDCPLGDEGRAVCYPEQTGASLSLTPADDELDLPADSTTFTLANDTDYEYHANFYGWSASKRVDGEWFHVAPQFWPQPLHILPAGASHEWSFAVDNDQSPTGGSSTDQDVTLAGLGGGEYAFTVQGWFPLGDDHDSFRGARRALRVTGRPGRTDADRRRLGVAGRRQRRRDHRRGTDRRRGAVGVRRRTLRRPAGATRQGTHHRADCPARSGDGSRPLFRNTIPFFEEGVQTVRLEAPDATIPPFGVDEPQYIRYEGETYEISTKRLD